MSDWRVFKALFIVKIKGTFLLTCISCTLTWSGKVTRIKVLNGFIYTVICCQQVLDTKARNQVPIFCVKSTTENNVTTSHFLETSSTSFATRLSALHQASATLQWPVSYLRLFTFINVISCTIWLDIFEASLAKITSSVKIYSWQTLVC